MGKRRFWDSAAEAVRPHLDANEGLAFARELEKIATRIRETVYQPIKYREFVPMDLDQPSAADLAHTDYFSDESGAVEAGSSYGDTLPEAKATFKLGSTTPIRGVLAAYGWTVEELRASLQLKRDLPIRDALAARNAIERKLGELALLGEAARGIPGLFTNAGVSNTEIPIAGGDKLWSLKTPEEVLADLHTMARKVVEDSKTAFLPDTLLVPLDSFNLLTETRLNAFTDATIAKVFLANSKWIKQIDFAFGIDTLGTGGTRKAIVYKRDPMVLGLIQPLEFTEHEVTRRDLKVRVPCEARSGGTKIYYPIACAYWYGF